MASEIGSGMDGCLLGDEEREPFVACFERFRFFFEPCLDVREAGVLYIKQEGVQKR